MGARAQSKAWRALDALRPAQGVAIGAPDDNPRKIPR